MSVEAAEAAPLGWTDKERPFLIRAVTVSAPLLGRSVLAEKHMTSPPGSIRQNTTITLHLLGNFENT